MSSRQQPLAEVERERLIESHLPLVMAVARRYAGRGAELEDLLQVGAIGLIKATDRFDPARGVGFANFAAPTIEGEIRHHLRDRTSPLRIPRELQRLSTELRRRQGELSAKLGRTPTVSELAGAVAADECEVERALAAEKARDSVSISNRESAAETAGAAEPFADTDDRLLLAARMRGLDERERRIIYLRFHADMTERQIAGEIGISQAHVSRLLCAALEKLRQEPDIDGEHAVRSDIAVKPAISPDSDRLSTREEAATNNPSTPKTGANVTSANRIEPGAEAREDSIDVSEAKSPPRHSGRFLVRMPSTLHEQLAQAAEREHVSLNRLVTEVLAASLSEGRRSQSSVPEPSPLSALDSAAGSKRPSARSLGMALAANLVVVVVTGLIAVALLVLALQRGI